MSEAQVAEQAAPVQTAPGHSRPKHFSPKAETLALLKVAGNPTLAMKLQKLFSYK